MNLKRLPTTGNGCTCGFLNKWKKYFSELLMHIVSVMSGR